MWLRHHDAAPGHSLRRPGSRLPERSARVGLSRGVTADDLGLEAVHDVLNSPAELGDASLVVPERPHDALYLVRVDLRQARKRLLSQDLGDPSAGDVRIARNGVVGRPARKRVGLSGPHRGALGGQDLGKAREKILVPVACAPLQLGGKDVDTGLAEPSLEGQFVLSFAALVAHLPKGVDIGPLEALQVGGLRYPFDQAPALFHIE